MFIAPICPDTRADEPHAEQRKGPDMKRVPVELPGFAVRPVTPRSVGGECELYGGFGVDGGRWVEPIVGSWWDEQLDLGAAEDDGGRARVEEARDDPVVRLP